MFRDKSVFHYLVPLLLITTGIVSYAQFGKGDIVFKGNTKEGVLFSHKIHTVSVDIKCEFCHNNLLNPYVQEAKQKGVPVAQLVDKAFCKNCHNDKIAFSVDEKTMCMKCHSLKQRGKENKKNDRSSS